MALDATPKGANANSYVTVAEANAYFLDRLGASAWKTLADEILDISSATISAEYSTLDDTTLVTVAGVVAPTPALALNDSIQIVTDVSAADGSYPIVKVISTTSFQYAVSGDASAVSSISYMDRSNVSQKASALIMATRYLDQLSYLGERTEDTQALAFPRMFLPDPDATAVYVGQTMRLRRDYLDEDTVPKRIKHATYELAFSLLKNPELLADPDLRQYKKVTIDQVLSVEVNANALQRPIDRNILNYIGPLLKAGASPAVALKR